VGRVVGNNVGNRKIRELFAKGSYIFFITLMKKKNVFLQIHISIYKTVVNFFVEVVSSQWHLQV